MPGGRVLIVDDDADMLHLVGLRLTAAGYQVSEADSGEAGLESFRANRPQLVITDMRMGEMDGLALFAHLQAEAPTLPVMILTAHGTIPDAVAATRRGVFSFLTKPFDGKELLRRVADAIKLSPLLDPEQSGAQWRKEVITVNVRMDELLRQALRVGEESRTAMLVGPAGTGKALLARAIHQAGPRHAQPFITLSCTNFPAQELEEMLLPSGPNSIFAQAGAGLLFLQDVGALSQMAQARLHSLLLAQARANDPLARLQQGNAVEEVPDVHILASTRRPLDSLVAEGLFRSDLFYLLGTTVLNVPPLCERAEDIPVLARHFLAKARPAAGLNLAPEALAALVEARWPGNVSQLKSVLENLADLSLTPVIPEAAIRRLIRDHEEEDLSAFDDARRDFEREYLVRLLQTTAGNVAHAARVAQRNRTEFYKLLARHGLDPATFKQTFGKRTAQ